MSFVSNNCQSGVELKIVMDSHKPNIVTGEASETDEDDESKSQHSPSKMMTSIQGAIVYGEDSESEDENVNSISSAVSALSQPTDSIETHEQQTQYKSLLHKRLRDANVTLRKDVQQFCHNAVNQAEKNISAIDQQLLRSQLTIQSAVASLHSLSLNSSAIRNKLQSILSSKFISNINVNSGDTKI